jgi:hypothetical protein
MQEKVAVSCLIFGFACLILAVSYAIGTETYCADLAERRARWGGRFVLSSPVLFVLGFLLLTWQAE